MESFSAMGPRELDSMIGAWARTLGDMVAIDGLMMEVLGIDHALHSKSPSSSARRRASTC